MKDQKWQPIETAPRDGSTVLVYFAGRLQRVMACSWTSNWSSDPKDEMWHIDDNKNECYPVRGYNDGDDTHWMPLPAAPVQS